MKITVIGRRYGRGSIGGISTYTYQKECQIVKDNPRLRLRCGDVVQISNSCVSKYARGQFGVIVERYRWVKFKYQIYTDYGATIMFLTGKKKGKLKKFSSCTMSQLSKQV